MSEFGRSNLSRSYRRNGLGRSTTDHGISMKDKTDDPFFMVRGKLNRKIVSDALVMGLRRDEKTGEWVFGSHTGPTARWVLEAGGWLEPKIDIATVRSASRMSSEKLSKNDLRSKQLLLWYFTRIDDKTSINRLYSGRSTPNLTQALYEARAEFGGPRSSRYLDYGCTEFAFYVLTGYDVLASKKNLKPTQIGFYNIEEYVPKRFIIERKNDRNINQIGNHEMISIIPEGQKEAHTVIVRSVPDFNKIEMIDQFGTREISREKLDEQWQKQGRQYITVIER